MTERRVGLLEVCMRRAGGPFRGGWRGQQVAEFVTCWAIAEADLGRPVASMAEFLGWWQGAYAERTAYRRLEQFRELFPEHEWPREITAPLVAAIAERAERVTKPDPALMMTPVQVAA